LSKAGQGDPDLSADKAEALRLINVSRETLSRLEQFVDLLIVWQRKTNLIAPSTLPQIWTRHVADSLQLLQLLQQLPQRPHAQVWVDLGSGGGFPAIPIACALAETAGAKVHMVESNGKKAAFLREALRVTGAPGLVHNRRIEDCGDSFGDKVDVVSARALASLKTLCDQAFPLIARGAVGLFLKGQDVEAELTEAAKYWRIESEIVRSRTSPDGRIVVVKRLTKI
jgi:16S rRNA (guanine527-N7)-methyltransferase